MNSPQEYLSYVRILVARTRGVQGLTVVQEQSKDDVGLYRYRLQLTNGDMLEAFEWYRIHAGRVEVGKYSFHWQDPEGLLIARWDNAPHHPELSTFPHHIHDGVDGDVKPHGPTRIEDVLTMVAHRLREVDESGQSSLRS
ncbi:MAG: hypothetical protein HC802_22765 [Caldilineaceae bacterium]|nr:hypothetical protein [Caldilineaceae bacterium]